MIRFKRYKSGDKRIDSADHNARADLLESLGRNLPADSYSDSTGTATRRRLGGSAGSTLLPVRLTAFPNTSSAKNYTAVGVEPNGAGGYSDISPAVNYTGTIFEKKGYVGIELGETVWVQANGTWTGSGAVLTVGTAIYSFEFVKARQTFDVVVAQTGGSNGNATTQASWTYRVDNADGHVLATGKAPEFKGFRFSAGLVTAGTRGIASYDDGGTLHLLTVNEVHGADDCV